MEFEEMQRAWDQQGAQPSYEVNEKALLTIVEAKKERAHRVTHRSELTSIIVNLGAGIFVTGLNAFGPPHYISLYLLAAWMLSVGVYVLISRVRRIRGSRRYDRSVQGDLDHAISLAAYQVRLSRLMRINILPMAAILLFGFREGNKSVWLGLFAGLFFLLAYYAGGMEHRLYKARRAELEGLKKKLRNN